MKNPIPQLAERIRLRRILARIHELDPRLSHDLGLADATLADLEARQPARR